MPNSFFDRVGGRATLERVHKRFYDKVYAHPWIGQFFVGVDQASIEEMQCDFMTGQFDGGKIFCGRPPGVAHTHIAVTEELFELRSRLLRESLVEEGLSVADQDHWIATDAKFRPVILRDVKDCNATLGPIRNFPNPERFKKAG